MGFVYTAGRSMLHGSQLSVTRTSSPLRRFKGATKGELAENSFQFAWINPFSQDSLFHGGFRMRMMPHQIDDGGGPPSWLLSLPQRSASKIKFERRFETRPTSGPTAAVAVFGIRLADIRQAEPRQPFATNFRSLFRRMHFATSVYLSARVLSRPNPDSVRLIYIVPSISERRSGPYGEIFHSLIYDDKFSDDSRSTNRKATRFGKSRI